MRLRMVLTMGVLTLALVVAMGIAFHAYVGMATKATLERTLHSRILRVQAALRQGLVPLASPGGPIEPAPDQSIVQVVTSQGRLLYTTGTAGDSSLLPRRTLSGLQEAHYEQIMPRGAHNPVLLLAQPVPGAGGEIVVVGASTDQVHDSLALVDQLLWGGGLLAVLLAALGAGLAASVVLRPVERMRRQAAMLSLGDSDVKLADPGTKDELARLADTLNHFLGRLQEAAAVQREFIAAASHELRTPLAGLQAELETRPPAGNHQDEALLQRIDRRVTHLVSLTEGLLRIAEGRGGDLALDLSQAALEAIVSGALVALTPLAAARGVALVLNAEVVPTLWVDSVRIAEVAENLVVNAIHHSPAGSAVEVEIRAEGDYVVLGVRDHGDGIPEELLPRIFEPFARGTGEHRRRPESSGLGLSLVLLLVTAHKGSVNIINHPGGGALAEVKLPAGDGWRIDSPPDGRPGASDAASTGAEPQWLNPKQSRSSEPDPPPPASDAQAAAAKHA
ncbi:MAG: HAMP domain-containing sensor histidine kinase [Actinomycetota bacterium]|nr:HAMP domain-containing sensor histidine kinase [Actinomycetota bacterium]